MPTMRSASIPSQSTWSWEKDGEQQSQKMSFWSVTSSTSSKAWRSQLMVLWSKVALSKCPSDTSTVKRILCRNELLRTLFLSRAALFSSQTLMWTRDVVGSSVWSLVKTGTQRRTRIHQQSGPLICPPLSTHPWFLIAWNTHSHPPLGKSFKTYIAHTQRLGIRFFLLFQ